MWKWRMSCSKIIFNITKAIKARVDLLKAILKLETANVSVERKKRARMK